MKKIMLLALAIGMLSCSRKEKDESAALLALKRPETNTKSEKPNRAFGEFYGSWKGVLPADAAASIAQKPIAITLGVIDPEGYVIGTCEIDGRLDLFHAQIKKRESGEYVTFHYTSSSAISYKIELPLSNPMAGFISLNNAKAQTPEQKFELERKPFVYDASASTDSSRYIDFSKPRIDKADNGETYESEYMPTSTKASYGINASSRKLTESELKNLKKTDLALLRNTIYARHGFIFRDENLATYFMNFSWYTPVTTNIVPQLTATEKANIKLIKRFEKYAEEYYDYFGR